MTFREVKNLLDMGIMPCIYYNNELDYIVAYSIGGSSYWCYTLFKNNRYSTDSIDGILGEGAIFA